MLLLTTTALAGQLDYPTAEVNTVVGGTNDFIQISTNTAKAHSPGQISWDATSQTLLADTGFSDVRVNLGQEMQIRFFNNTGSAISNGTPINTFGTTNGVFIGVPSDASSPFLSLSFVGLSTALVEDGDVGVATKFGEVRDIDTSALSVLGPVYLAEGGGMTMTRPKYPSTILIIGGATTIDPTNRIVTVSSALFKRTSAGKSYSFTSQGITGGEFWKAGFYDWETDDANLDEGSPTFTLGTADRAYAAHVGIVAAAAGTVDTGQVGLRVIGIEDSETGAQMANSTNTITTDITTLTADLMQETAAKYSGEVTGELYVVSGSPTAYSLDCNYGYSKYDDMQNRDFTISGFEAVWHGRASDDDFNIQVYKHATDGWTYAASGFEPGNGVLIDRLVDQGLAGEVVSGEDGAWKRVDLSQFIDGNGSEGFLIKVTTDENNTIQTMDMHIDAYSEELTK